jgi:hypothetical protein
VRNENLNPVEMTNRLAWICCNRLITFIDAFLDILEHFLNALITIDQLKNNNKNIIIKVKLLKFNYTPGFWIHQLIKHFADFDLEIEFFVTFFTVASANSRNFRWEINEQDQIWLGKPMIRALAPI